MNRVYNFSAGPSMLPLPVLEKAQNEMTSYADSGMSVMELSHRSALFTDIITEAEQLLRDVMQIPANYKVLFMQGGASQQFAMVPMNLLGNSKKADFIHTGSWSKKAIKEAQKFGDTRVIASSEDKNFTYIPEVDRSMIDPEADYVHITTNNTIEGTAFSEIPDTGDVPLVADMSSNILSEQVDVSKFGLIYAGAQKNIGPAGLTVVIIREDLIGLAPETCPTMLDYKTFNDSGSLHNTPPTFSIYMAKLVFEWLKDLGGLKEMELMNREKAAILYNYLDASDMFASPVEKSSRSIMNIPFIIPNHDLDATFIKEAKAAGFETLKGHRSVGGMRASIYNAMPIQGVRDLVDFMKKFEADYL
ncbi:3-phosphoserine/phosphohydroxythreonine transaminase [Aquibacillus koreensis]|uniref:Phosphoserine aminotransferase n=1 Tax=Aquibacillus koreensis TaxID=279446 RepID=A0A9X4AK71_9BACI|nr:3-phosphoserine/phosphohydroxythreonine transaminase [Aquibacillus koreensis]MCT2537818.1 3-phosphoserine/phosphohydroxythreonine transaminase [Aquibacillus koreensis]MDC3421150.1 3-phosphoserine/phosphohydroxythreonine transaminase [Aquibacillus koreensis]